MCIGEGLEGVRERGVRKERMGEKELEGGLGKRKEGKDET